MEKREELIAYFETLYEKKGENDCWLWKACETANNYGYVRVGGKYKKAHRISYQLYKGNFPSHLCICHHCDTPACVNPKHLFVGTQKDNMQDKVKKGRTGIKKGDYKVKGVQHPLSKFTKEQAEKIRDLYNNGIPIVVIAKKLKVAINTIRNITLKNSYNI